MTDSLPARQPRLPLIHIGMPKTATKTLQWRLFAQHNEIHYLGRFDGPSFRAYRQFDHCRDSTVQSLMQQIAYGNVRHPDFTEASALYRASIAPAIAANRVPVWSWESYSTDTLEMRQIRAYNLKQVFGDANILMTIRHPLRLLESAFLQFLKSRNVGRRRRRFDVSYCPDINRWLTEEWDVDVLHHLQYAETIRAYLDQFGRERVHVLPFEQLVADSTSFFAGICNILGVDSAQGTELVAAARDNVAWSSRELGRLQAIQRAPLASLRFRFGSNRTRLQLLDLGPGGVPATPGPRLRLEIAPDLRSRIMAHTRDGNLWLADLFDLPLGDYGYLDPQ